MTTTNIMILTIPKAGTHLIFKFMNLLTDRECYWNHGFVSPFEFKDIFSNEDNEKFTKKMDEYNANKYLVCAHTNVISMYQTYINKNNDLNQKAILHIRDLRDVIISLSLNKIFWKQYDKIIFNNTLFNGNYEQEKYDEVIGNKENVQKVLMAFVKNNNFDRMFYPYKYASELINFINNNKNNQNIYISRFEKIIGNKGNGSDKIQKEEIINIAKFINLDIDKDKIAKINSDLFGIKEIDCVPQLTVYERTFRKGQIGGWKEYFTEQHLDEFEKNFGYLQMALGYPVRNEYNIDT